MTYRQAKLTEAISLIRLGAKILNQIDSDEDFMHQVEMLHVVSDILERQYEREFG